jgi:hypothetical protein
MKTFFIRAIEAAEDEKTAVIRETVQAGTESPFAYWARRLASSEIHFWPSLTWPLGTQRGLSVQQTEETNPECQTAIDYKSLYAGVRQASDQRVREMAEAYAWIELLMEPLADQKLVPFDFAEVEDIWLDQGTLDHPELQRARLNNAEAAKQALTSLGLIRPMSTGKYDVPDIYRLQFRLGRRGGIPLANRTVGN